MAVRNCLRFIKVGDALALRVDEVEVPPVDSCISIDAKEYLKPASGVAR
jgi:hypothetical protein